MCASAVWRQDGDTAKALLAARLPAKDFIKFVDGKRLLCDPVSFAAYVAAAKIAELSEATSTAGETPKRRPRQDDFPRKKEEA